MSHTCRTELCRAVDERLKLCTAAEGLAVLAAYAGTLLATAPGPQRDTARALFLAMLDQAVAIGAGHSCTEGHRLQ